jgi:hypothetical protein
VVGAAASATLSETSLVAKPTSLTICFSFGLHPQTHPETQKPTQYKKYRVGFLDACNVGGESACYLAVSLLLAVGRTVVKTGTFTV